MDNQPTTPTKNTWAVAFGKFPDSAQAVIEKALTPQKKPAIKPVQQPPEQKQKPKKTEEQTAAKVKRVALMLSQRGRNTPHILKFLKRVKLHYLDHMNMRNKISRLRIKNGYRTNTETKAPQIIALFRSGKTYDEISQSTGSRINYVRDCLAKHGMIKRKKHTERARIKKLLSMGKTRKQIAEITGVSVSTVTRNKKRIKQCQSIKQFS